MAFDTTKRTSPLSRTMATSASEREKSLELDIVENEELKHYGVLGMRWGAIRSRAQLASAGVSRYKVSKTSQKKFDKSRKNLERIITKVDKGVPRSASRSEKKEASRKLAMALKKARKEYIENSKLEADSFKTMVVDSFLFTAAASTTISAATGSLRLKPVIVGGWKRVPKSNNRR